MERFITDERTGIEYKLVGDYYLPLIEVPANDRPIGRYGTMRKEYLKNHRPALYEHLVLQGKLYEHCADINEQAQHRLDVIMEQLSLKWNITEDLKHRDQLRWVGLMNQAKHCAEENIMKELIYE